MAEILEPLSKIISQVSLLTKLISDTATSLLDVLSIIVTIHLVVSNPCLTSHTHFSPSDFNNGLFIENCLIFSYI